MILPLCTVLVRHIWSAVPSAGLLMCIMEWVQQRVTKVLQGLSISYIGERLRQLGLFSLENEKLRGILSIRIND